MSKENKTIIITGTHITPAIELINQLKKDNRTDWNIHYVGRQYTSPIEKIPAAEYDLIPKMGVNYHVIDCGKLDRRYWPNTLMGLPKTIKGIFQALNYVSQIKPNIVVSFGGYLSVPVIIAASCNGISSITHEQTMTNSLSTKINSLFASKVALTFDNPHQTSALPRSKVIITGNLLRSDLKNNTSTIFDKLIGRPSKPIIYITAGSQGSHKINQAIQTLLPHLTKKYIVIHQTGKLDFSEIKQSTADLDNYYPFDYIAPSDIGWVFHHTDIIISRCGANSIQEIAAFKLKNILIPLPVTQQDEQKLNAKWLCRQQPDITIILDDLTFTADQIKEAISKLDSIKTQVSPLNLNTNYRLLNLIHEIC